MHSAGTNVPLAEAYRHCERITRRSGSSFVTAFWLLPGDKRRALHALYAFCRFADDIADDLALAGDRGAILARWREELEAVHAGTPTTAVGVALADTVRRYRLPREPLADLLAGIESDLCRDVVETFDDLRLYCYRVASTVGLLIVRILGCDDALALEYAETLGIAVQLTNVLRDVGADARSGRVYLPACDLEHAGIDPGAVTDALGGEPLRLLMATYAERARMYYQRAETLIPAGERPALRAAEAMGRIYWSLLEELRRHSFPCDAEPLRLSRRRRLALAASVWVNRDALASAVSMIPLVEAALSSGGAGSVPAPDATTSVNEAAEDIAARKRSHLDLCIDGDVEGRSATLLGEVHLLHEALPDMALDDVDTSVELFGRRLSAPVLISGMTGGTAGAAEINRAMAIVAGRLGLGMGVGSQRAMLADRSTAATYRVRDVAPDIVLMANLGAVQARDAGAAAVIDLAGEIEADALCIHLNAAQELVQDEGDRDFGGCLEAIAELAEICPVPVIVKETGCGMSPYTLARIRAAGIGWVDVAGAGGTTWTGVEALRGSNRQQQLGADLREWGIPTAAAVSYARRAGLHAIASGGIRSAGDVTAAIALGAEAAALALPFLRAYSRDGLEGAVAAGSRLCEAVRARMLLAGAVDIAALREAPRVVGSALRAWTEPFESTPRGLPVEGRTAAAGPFGKRAGRTSSANRQARAGAETSARGG